MSFRPNNFQQFSIFDSHFGLTDREIKIIRNSWASVFSDKLFPMIDEKPFAVLYSDIDSRPNTPVNIIIGALILKELFGLTDDDLFFKLIVDVSFQYALHTTSYYEQPLSDRTLGRFRQRCLAYYEKTGIDLISECINKLDREIAAVLNIGNSLQRMDSAMIAANIRHLSRFELLYRCVADFVIYLHKNHMDTAEEFAGLAHYTERDDYNKYTYYKAKTSAKECLAQVIKDGEKLMESFKDSCAEVPAYQLLVRVMDEQTIVEDGVRRMKTKNDKSMNSDMLQNPSDPDATFRVKAGKGHKGYIINVVESVNKNGSIITDFQVEKNTYSDSKFLEDMINRTSKQDTPVNIVTDGAYSNQKLQAAAAEKNINICTTDLTGRKTKDIWADVEFNEDETAITKCPNGNTPVSCKYDAKTGKCKALFDKSVCEHCPHFNECHPKKTRHGDYTIQVSAASAKRAQSQRYMQTEEFKSLARIRNGIETVPSTLRRKYNIDKMPVRGLARIRMWAGLKIAAFNFRKLFTGLTHRGKYAQNPMLV